MIRFILRDVHAAVRLAACASLLAAPAIASAQDCDQDGVPDATEIAAPQRIAVCVDPRIVDACSGSCGCEVNNVLAAMSAIGSVTTFTNVSGAQIAALLAGGSTVVIPEQELGSLLDILGSGANEVRDAVLLGGRLVVYGDAGDRDAQLLNFIISGNASGPLSSVSGDPLARAVTVPVEFATMPAQLEYQEGTYPIAGWEPSEVIYGRSACSGVALRPVGSGAVGFIAYDFFCPDGTANANNWIEAAQRIARAMDHHGQRDCNGNAIPDSCDIASGAASDCDGDGRPDSCEFVAGANRDLDSDGLLDACEDDDGDGVSNALDRCPMLDGEGSCLGCPPEVCLAQPRDICMPRVEIACNGGVVSGSLGSAQLPFALSDVIVTAHADANVGRQVDEFLRVVLEGRAVPDIHDPVSSECGWRTSDLVLSASEFNAIIADGSIDFIVATGLRTDCFCSNLCFLQFRYVSAGQPAAGSDFDGDGVAIESDPCPAAAGGSDLDDDDDLRADLDDAYPCVPAKQDVDSLFPPEAIAAFLSQASAATVDGTGMTQPQLCMVGDFGAHIAPNGIGGTFTLTRLVTPAQLDAILAKAFVGNGFLGGATITVDAFGMTTAQLVEVAQAIPCVAGIQNLTVDSALSAAHLGGLLSKATGATVLASGMTPEQVAAVAGQVAHVAPGGISGAFTITFLASAEGIDGILAKSAAGSVIGVDAAGMSDGQLAAVAGGVSAVASVENLTVTASLSPAQIAALVSKAPAGEATVHATGMSAAQLSAGISAAAGVRITGLAVVTADFSAAAISEIASSLVASQSSVRFVTTGMGPDQLAAVNAAIAAIVAANGGVNPFCDTTDADHDGFFADACDSVRIDCDDTEPRYVDADADGIGSDQTAACGVPFRGDRCPNDPAKRTPGYCGCGNPETDADADGTPECADGRVILTLEPLADAATGEEFVVRVHTSQALTAGTVFTGLQLAMYFDTDWLRLERIDPAPGGPLTLEVAEQVDQNTGMICYAIGLDDAGSATGEATGLVDLVFSLKQAPLCGRSSLLGFTQIGPFSSLLATNGSGVVVPVAVDLDNLDLDVLPPVLTGVPASVPEIPADIGLGTGAFVPAPGLVTAADLCDGGLPVSLVVTYPDGSTGSSWPSDGIFPIGVTTLEWTSVDSSGNIGRAVRTVAVGDYQVLDLTVTIDGVFSGETTRSVLVTGTGGGNPWSLPLTVVFPASSAGAVDSSVALNGLHIPPRAAQECITVKSVQHSLAKAVTPVAGIRRYSASATLVQGDSNDSNSVDIFDFSIFAASRSVLGNFERSPDAVSNFNADHRIDNIDFGFIGISFFRNGESCTSGAQGDGPVQRVSVKELRRRGLGHLVAADLNRDGWVDIRDIEAYMRGDGDAAASN